MSSFVNSLEDTDTRRVDWNYVGRFLKIGKLHYINPKTGKSAVSVFIAMYISRYMNVFKEKQRTKKRMVLTLSLSISTIGTFALPFVQGTQYNEPHILLIKGYRPAVDSYVLSFPAGFIILGSIRIRIS